MYLLCGFFVNIFLYVFGRRMIGNIIFIGELYKCDLIVQKILDQCFEYLITNLNSGDEDVVEGLLSFVLMCICLPCLFTR